MNESPLTLLLVGFFVQGIEFSIPSTLLSAYRRRVIWLLSSLFSGSEAVWSLGIPENIDKEAEFVSNIEEKVQSHFNMTLHEKICDFFNLTSEGESQILEKFKDNLRNGKFRFVVLMDHMNKRLKDLISFLNRNCSFDIFLLVKSDYIVF